MSALKKEIVEVREPICATLTRASSELHRVVDRIDQIEAAVGHALTHPDDHSYSRSQELQQLDHIRQEVQGIAEFLKAIGHQSQRGWLVGTEEAASIVLLGDLARRLSNDVASAIQKQVQPAEYLLFGDEE